jgi:hypothetical protein
MLTRLIARALPLSAALLIAAACSAQVLGTPGTLPNGRRIPIPPDQQNLPETSAPQQPANPQTQGQPSNQATPAPAAVTAAPSLLDKPAQPATVTLQSGRLAVAADNSSLTDILHQLSSTSGMTIDGLDKDTRVFGNYGPGDPREILSTLLDGAGYNVMMVGNTASGAPRQLVLSVRSNAPIPAQPVTAAPEPDDDQDDNVPLNNNFPQPGDIQPHTSLAPAPQPPNPNGTPKTPQQILQELRQQQQQGQQPQ